MFYLAHSCIVNVNHISLNYPLLKMFCHTDNYNYCVDYIISRFKECIQRHGNFSCTIDLNTFTISAAQRHTRILLNSFFVENVLMTLVNNYSESLTKLDIENPPSAMEQLYKLFNNFIDPQVKSKIQILSKSNNNAYIYKNKISNINMNIFITIFIFITILLLYLHFMNEFKYAKELSIYDVEYTTRNQLQKNM